VVTTPTYNLATPPLSIYTGYRKQGHTQSLQEASLLEITTEVYWRLRKFTGDYGSLLRLQKFTGDYRSLLEITGGK